MSEEQKQDETAGFVVETDDTPQVESHEEEQQQEEPANSESEAESDEGAEPEADQKSEGHEQNEDESKSERGKGRLQKRINDLTRKRTEAEQRAERAEAKLAELEANSSQSTKEPVESDFENFDDYLDAMESFEANQKEALEAEQAQEQKEEPSEGDSSQLTDSQKVAMEVIREQVGNAEKPEDFEAVALNHEVPITGDMLEALAECDDPAKVMYHLGKNKDLAADIADKTPAQQMREIAKLDLTVNVKPAKPTKTTNAPDPISPVRGSDAQEKPVSEMSFSEYEAYQNKRERNSKSW